MHSSATSSHLQLEQEKRNVSSSAWSPLLHYGLLFSQTYEERSSGAAGTSLIAGNFSSRCEARTGDEGESVSPYIRLLSATFLGCVLRLRAGAMATAQSRVFLPELTAAPQTDSLFIILFNPRCNEAPVVP